MPRAFGFDAAVVRRLPAELPSATPPIPRQLGEHGLYLLRAQPFRQIPSAKLDPEAARAAAKAAFEGGAIHAKTRRVLEASLAGGG